MCISILYEECAVLRMLILNGYLIILGLLGPFFRKTVADSNAPVQEKALDALIGFLRAADADAAR